MMMMKNDNYDELFCGMVADKRYLALFPAETIVRDPQHRESPTRREQGLNLRRTWVEVWTWAQNLSEMKLFSSDNHYTTACFKKEYMLLKPTLALI